MLMSNLRGEGTYGMYCKQQYKFLYHKQIRQCRQSTSVQQQANIICYINLKYILKLTGALSRMFTVDKGKAVTRITVQIWDMIQITPIS